VSVRNERKGINPLTQTTVQLNIKVHQKMGRNTALSIVQIKLGANYQFQFMNILVHLVGGMGGDGKRRFETCTITKILRLKN
jgi:hypothetical protein